ncbi:hypothetical protein F1D05_10065 [Kribbella qitaiheensis]|uniref:Uncharacterized protein n=1 Tax=Kribbella qitaiheensis TaxID=1544730 RepID=A0A7G6WW10_9ACTN|nr:hypothetical protein [Kribbella qitaiheensis]QNE18175.1 hypothetical protein F1D05_10065 [Kribbella qitaiheensis]
MIAMNSTWLPFAVALLSGFFALAGHWLSGAQTRQRAAQDRDARRAERRFDLRNELYSNLALQVDAFTNAVKRVTGPEQLLATLADLRRAAAPIVYQSRQIADGPLRNLLVAAETLAGQAGRLAASSPVRIEAVTAFQAAREALIDSLAADLDRCL